MKSRSYCTYFAYFAYFAFFAFFDFVLLQHGWMSVRPQSFTSAVNNHKCCMSFQFPPYWNAFHLFHWERPGRYPLTCEENQPTFQELPAINPITAAMVVGGGTSTTGPSHGETSNSGNKLGDTMSQGHFLNVYVQYANYVLYDKMTLFIHKM